MEHFAFHPRQGKYRQVHHHDDQLTENQRPARLFGRSKDLVKTFRTGQHPSMLVLCVGQPADCVFNNHHRAVNNDAEIKRAQTHEVGTDFIGKHPGKGEQHCQRYHHGGNQCRTNVAKEQKQDCDNQNRAFNQVFLDRRDGFFNQIGTVINRDGFNTCRQRTIDLLKPGSNSPRDCTTVFADQHEDSAQHHLATVLGGGPGT